MPLVQALLPRQGGFIIEVTLFLHQDENFGPCRPPLSSAHLHHQGFHRAHHHQRYRGVGCIHDCYKDELDC